MSQSLLLKAVKYQSTRLACKATSRQQMLRSSGLTVYITGCFANYGCKHTLSTFTWLYPAADSKMKLLEESVALDSVSGKEYDVSANSTYDSGSMQCTVVRCAIRLKLTKLDCIHGSKDRCS